VAPLAYPLSPIIFGRVGIVAQYDPADWRIFDARQPLQQALYVAWLQCQPIYRHVAMSAHSTFYNQLLRGQFRRRYHIDAILFHPDQHSRTYTTQADVWMAITDWTARGGIATGDSFRFIDPRLTVVAEEEFEDQLYGLYRVPLLQMSLTRPAGLGPLIARTYTRRQVVRIGS